MLAQKNAQIVVYTLYTHALIEQIFRLNANVVQFCVNIRGDGVSGEPVVTESPVNHGSKRNANNQAEHLLSSQVQSSSEEGDRSSFGGAPSEKSRW